MPATRLLPSPLLALGLLLLSACAGGVHPRFYEAPGTHGLDFKLQESDCRSCHGDDLAGGTTESGADAISCDSCHEDGWRESCTYCHGGTDTDDGAPPRDLHGDVVDAPFPHTPHVTPTNHADWSCAPCHATPTDVLSPGHTSDDSPGRAEVDFSEGQAPDTEWSGTGCSNNACHGDGQGDAGDVELADAPLGCDGCHAGPDSGSTAQSTMSGRHRKHLGEGVGCDDCHGDVSSSGAITSPDAHVNLQVEVDMPPEVTVNQGRCTGVCHNENHNNESW